MRTIIILVMLTSLAFSQLDSESTVYEIPFASEGNEIELEVFNDSEIKLTNVVVTAIEKPEWVKFGSEQEVITELESKQNGKVLFKFDVENLPAKVGGAKILEEETFKFQITANNQTWNKEINITVLPPEKFELNQNYPNPFNPITTISYTIPGNVETQSHASVQLMIYDILGREVETLVNEEHEPGFYKVEWNANHLASGMYVYQLNIKNSSSDAKYIRKKMLLMK